MRTLRRFEDSKMAGRLQAGHPVGYLFRREMQESGSSKKPIVDRLFDKSSNLYRKNLVAHFGCVNAIEFSNDGTLLVSGGDDRRVLLWNVQKAIYGKEEPMPMQAEHLSNVFCLAFDSCNQKIFSAGNDDQVIIHDLATGAPLDYFMHEQPVFGLSIDPMSDNIFSSACDDGRILIYDIREPSSTGMAGTNPFCLVRLNSAFHSVMFNPIESRIIVSANSKEGVALWDVRMPRKCLMRFGGLIADQCCMSARFSKDGSKILALRRRLPPVLYAANSTSHLFQFNHPGYYNSCTMKSCCFAGTDDQFVLSGSDNFHMYMWKIPPESSDRWVDQAQLVLKGHRSIVNQVRYNETHSVIASSGVEKLVKLWSPFPMASTPGGRKLSTLTYEMERTIYTHDEYINLVMQSGQFMSLTYESAGRKNTGEDPRMMAFFDALVQRDINGLSDDSDGVREASYTTTIYSPPDSSSSSENSDEVAMNSSTTLNTSSETPTSSQNQSQNSEELQSSQNVAQDSDDNGFVSSQNSDDVVITSQETASSQEISWTLTVPEQLANQDDPSFLSDDNSVESRRSSENQGGNEEDEPQVEQEDNMITKLITEREDHLRKLARAHVLWEATKKTKKRERVVSSSSSSSESSKVKSRMQNRKTLSHNNGKSKSPGSSNVDNNTKSSSQQTRSSSHFLRRIKNPSTSKKCKTRRHLHNLKSLRYDGKNKIDKRPTSPIPFYNYWKTKAESRNGSCSVQQPCTSANAMTRSTVVNSGSSSTTSSSSSSSTSSDSDVAPAPSVSSSKRKVKLISDGNTPSTSKKLSESSSSSDSSAEEEEKRMENSIAFKMSPLIRKIEMERLRNSRRTVALAKNSTDEKCKQNKNSTFGVGQNSTSEFSSSSASEEELPTRRKRIRMSLWKKGGAITTRNDNGTDRIPKINKSYSSASHTPTHDSGIEVENTKKSEQAGNLEDPQPCCSKACSSSNGNSDCTTTDGTILGLGQIVVGKAISTDPVEHTTEETKPIVAFRKLKNSDQERSRKRHYRHKPNSSD